MKNILDELPAKDREILAIGFESPFYATLKKVMEIARLNAAKACLTSTTFEEVKHLQGQAHGVKMLHLNLKDLHKKERAMQEPKDVKKTQKR